MSYTVRFCLDSNDSIWQQHSAVDAYGLDEDRITWYINEIENVAKNNSFSYEVIDNSDGMLVACNYLPRHVNIKEENPVSHPKHYTSHPSGIECIQITRHMSFNLGNAMKYLWRADEKGAPIQDLEKAAWYIQDEITKRKKNENSA